MLSCKPVVICVSGLNDWLIDDMMLCLRTVSWQSVVISAADSRQQSSLGSGSTGRSCYTATWIIPGLAYKTINSSATSYCSESGL